jgi:hypothetical protein
MVGWPLHQRDVVVAHIGNDVVEVVTVEVDLSQPGGGSKELQRTVGLGHDYDGMSEQARDQRRELRCVVERVAQ